MQKIFDLIKYFKRYDLIGLNIKDRLKWEAKINLVDGKYFELDFIDSTCKNCSPDKLIIWNCDIVRNFFLAKTDSLLKSPWDENLYMREHEDFFYAYKQKGFKVGYTDWCEGQYIGEKSKKDVTEYSKLRKLNMVDGLKNLQRKYKISGWVKYKNLENTKK